MNEKKEKEKNSGTFWHNFKLYSELTTFSVFCSPFSSIFALLTVL